MTVIANGYESQNGLKSGADVPTGSWYLWGTVIACVYIALCPIFEYSCRLGLRPLLGILSRVVTMGTKKLGSQGPGFLRFMSFLRMVLFLRSRLHTDPQSARRWLMHIRAMQV